jgi:hypothetical protein
MVIAGWMYWDAESSNWRPIVTTSRDTSLEAFQREPESRFAICRPCSEVSHAECEGANVCKCPCRDELSLEFLVHELEDDWNLSDKAKAWPD